MSHRFLRLGNDKGIVWSDLGVSTGQSKLEVAKDSSREIQRFVDIIL